MNYILYILSIIADILTIGAYWQINSSSPFSQKIGFSIALVLILTLAIIASIPHDKVKVINYNYDKINDKVTAVVTKKSDKIILSSLVTIYFQDSKSSISEVVAIGAVSDTQNKRNQVEIVNVIDKDKLNRIITSSTYCEKYYVLPYVEYSNISEFFK